MKTFHFQTIRTSLCALLVFTSSISFGQVIDDGTFGNPANYDRPGWRNNEGPLKLGEIISPGALNLGIGHWLHNNHSSNIGDFRHFNLQVERGNISHLLKSGVNAAFGTDDDDIWSSIGVNLTRNPWMTTLPLNSADFYGFRSQLNKYGAWFGLQSTDPGSILLDHQGVVMNNHNDIKNALVAWGNFGEAGGTPNRLKFSYFTNSGESEKMTILPSGEVGIGVSNPQFGLSVVRPVGVVLGTPPPNYDDAVIVNFHNSRVPSPIMQSPAGTYHTFQTISNYYGKAQMGLDDAGSCHIGSREMLAGTEGKVYFTVKDDEKMVELSGEGMNCYKDFVIGNNPGHRFLFHTQYWTGTPEFLAIAPEDGSGWNFDRALTIHRAGDFAVTVEGKFGAREVEVKLGTWNDHVFNEDYKLASLDEVESFIKENKHLPEIPSEKEIIEEGLNVGDMLSLQMKKIEELYLYVIELKKENEKQHQDNEDLKKLLLEMQK